MTNVLSMERLKELVPAAFTDRPASQLSEAYRHVNTAEAVRALSKQGWFPVAANQKRARDKAAAPYAKHLIRFRHEGARGIFSGGTMAVGQAFPELVLVNSHNGSSRYELMAGIFVLACSNGLIVAEETLGAVAIRHVRSHEEELLSAAQRVSEQLKPIMNRVQRMRDCLLPIDRQRVFAREALQLKFPAGNSPFAPDQILVSRRESDRRNDLWAVFNRVQENLLAGQTVGVTQGPNGRRFTSRPVRDVNVQLNLNQALWTLADKFATSDN